MTKVIILRPWFHHHSCGRGAAPIRVHWRARKKFENSGRRDCRSISARHMSIPFPPVRWYPRSITRLASAPSSCATRSRSNDVAPNPESRASSWRWRRFHSPPGRPKFRRSAWRKPNDPGRGSHFATFLVNAEDKAKKDNKQPLVRTVCRVLLLKATAFLARA